MSRKLLNIELNRLSPEAFKKANKQAVVLLLDNVRSQHNIGSAFRTADAFLIDQIHLCGICACPPSPEIRKTALGAEDCVDWVYHTSALAAVQELKEKGYTLVAVEQVEHSVPLHQFQPQSHQKYAFVFGNEVKGVQQAVVDICDICVEIPQAGAKHSLNVSVSVGVVLWDITSKLGFPKNEPDKGVKSVYQHIYQALLPTKGSEEAQSLTRILVEHYTGITQTQMMTYPDTLINDEQIKLLLNAQQKIVDHVPIQYLLGQVEFMDLVLKVSPAVLIPRPETEELVRWILADFGSTSAFQILDIGTGSACIAISLAQYFTQSSIHAIDISSSALEVAQANALLNHVQIHFQLEDLFEQQWNTELDIIVSNPPYVCDSEAAFMQANVLDHEPHQALFVPDTDPLLYYRAIKELASRCLKTNGVIYLEINEAYGETTRDLFEPQAWQTELRKDIFGKDRMLKVTKRSK